MRHDVFTPPATATGPNADGVLTRVELAQHLRISLRTVEEWQREGALPFIKIGRVVLFHWPDVIAHLRKHYFVRRTRNGKGGQS